MLKNYLKIAFKVLLRRKFFTFISLFCISFTLIVLMVFTTFLDHRFRPDGPEGKSERFLVVDYMTMRSPDGDSQWDSSPGYRFLDRYVRTMTSPEKIAIYSTAGLAISYQTGSKITAQVRRTDGTYWEILDFELIEGRTISHEDEAQANMVAVVNQAMAERFYGDDPVLGKPLTVDGQRFSIIGVVKNVSEFQSIAFSEIWVPISTSKTTSYKDAMMGNFNALLLADSPASFPKIKTEFQNLLPRVQFPDPKEYNSLQGGADTKFEAFARDFFSEPEKESPNSTKLLAGIFLLILVFMLLPTLNLVNINLSRIMERSSEIGVRKAFGAPSNMLVMQFVVENLVLTFVGGALGFVGAKLVLGAIAGSGLIAYAEFQMNHRLFFQGLGLIVFFGILSGVLPAWRMSRMHPVEALRGRTL